MESIKRKWEKRKEEGIEEGRGRQDRGWKRKNRRKK
jgi:hypothetical protein